MICKTSDHLLSTLAPVSPAEKLPTFKTITKTFKTLIVWQLTWMELSCIGRCPAEHVQHSSFFLVHNKDIELLTILDPGCCVVQSLGFLMTVNSFSNHSLLSFYLQAGFTLTLTSHCQELYAIFQKLSRN